MAVIILFLAMCLTVGCGPQTSPGWENVKKIDAVKYAACLMEGQNEGQSLEQLKKECEDSAVIKKSIKIT